MSKGVIRSNFGTISLVFALLVSLGLNTMFVQRVRSLESALRPQAGGIQKGDLFPAFPVETLAGEKQVVDLKTGETVVYVMSPSCIWCLKNYDNIVALAKATRGEHRFIGLSLGSDGGIAPLQARLATQPLPFEVFHLPPESDTLVEAAGLIATPQLAVVVDGRVSRVWYGALMNDSLREVEDFFGVSLPGLRDNTEVPN
jgi:hypothetical protein